MLDRYKKKGGFIQLLQTIETAQGSKKEQFLQIVANESEIWAEEIRKKLLTVEKIFSWSPETLVEILTRLQGLTLASSLHGDSQEYVEKVLSCMPPISKKKVYDQIAEINPTPGEKSTSRNKIITEVRGMLATGVLKFEKIDPELVIPDKIEELLESQSIERILKSKLSNEPPSSGAGTSVNSTHQNEISKNSPNSSVNPGSTTSSMPSSVQNVISISAADQQQVIHELEHLRKKVNHLTAEVNALKHENTLLKDKLTQIKRIA